MRTLWLALALVSPSGSAFAQMWVDQATISATAPLTSGRLCYTDGRDVACDAAAPLITTSGTIYGKFTGDGSGLTGISAGSSDRIVSGTTSMVAISNTGFVSITQNGGSTGWFDPTSGLVALGVSTTGTISGTSGYFSGSVGIGTGTVAPDAALTVSSSSGNAFVVRGPFQGYKAIEVSSTGNITFNYTWEPGDAYQMRMLPAADRIDMYSKLRFTNGNAPGTLMEVPNVGLLTQQYDVAEGNIYRFGISSTYVSDSIGFASASGAITLNNLGNESMRIVSNGWVGIGVITPSSTLDVNTYTGMRILSAGNPGSHYVTIGKINGSLSGFEMFNSRYDGQTVLNYRYDPSSGLNVTGNKIEYGSRINSIDDSTYPANLLFAPRGALDTRPALFMDNLGRVSIAMITPTVSLEVSGTISATHFVGDGSGLTGVTAGSSDRIVSGTTSILASQNTSLTFTTAGSDRMIVGENGNVGIGTATPSEALEVNGGVYASAFKTDSDGTFLQSSSSHGSGSYFSLASVSNYGTFMDLSNQRGVITWNQGNVFAAGLDITGATNGIGLKVKSGFAGIGVTPTVPLEVSGTISATAVQVAQSAITCNGAAVGTLRRNPTTNRLQICLDH